MPSGSNKFELLDTDKPANSFRILSIFEREVCLPWYLARRINFGATVKDYWNWDGLELNRS
jgi:hypothetical protein